MSRAPLGLLLHLALRGLREDRLVVALLVAAVMAGMGFQVPITANLVGYRSELLAQGLSGGFGEVRLRPRGGGRFPDGEALAARVRAQAPGAVVLPLLTLPGAVGREGRFHGAPVTGMDQTAARRPFRLVAGAPVSRGDERGVVLGAALAARLGVKVGDPVELRFLAGAVTQTLLDPGELGRHTATVRGLSAGAFGLCGQDAVLVDRAFLAGATALGEAADLLVVYSDAPATAAELAARLEAAFPEASVKPWSVDSGFLRAAVEAVTAVTAVTSSMTVLAVLIPVWALLHIHVLRRRREIGLLRALGFARGEVFVVYLLQALLVGLAGVALGALLGYALVAWFRGHPIFAMDDFVLRPVLSPQAFLSPALLVLATTLAAGVLPALGAARVDPARTLRGLP